MRLKNKISIVTGGGSGIGQAIALAMAQEGAKVVITGRTKSKLEETCNKIRSGGLAADFVVGDVSKVEDVKAIVQKVLKEDGRIDVLINNAALLTKAAPIENITEAEWDAVMRVNLKGPFLCCREVAPHMKARRSGKIINIGSTAVFLTFWRVFPYATSKGGLLAFTRILAMEMAPFGVCVNAILPGPVGTGVFDQIAPEETKDFFRKRIPLGRVGTPGEVANLACFLASDEASYITGEPIIIAGGLPGSTLMDS
jgi:NAD(P)-dependent dehydrogenase (short-subunit alcohol dehydrogenase family)